MVRWEGDRSKMGLAIQGEIAQAVAEQAARREGVKGWGTAA